LQYRVRLRRPVRPSIFPASSKKAAEIKAKDVDTFACLSVNDVFVMDAWGKDQNAGDRVEMLVDGSAALTKELCTVLDLTDRGLGVRSSRYSMIVDDGTVTAVNLEEGGGFEVSDADTILGQL
jgi:peroxiredoxin